MAVRKKRRFSCLTLFLPLLPSREVRPSSDPVYLVDSRRDFVKVLFSKEAADLAASF